MLEREVRLLMRKEWRQLLRSRGALATAIFFPVLMLLVIPGAQIIGLSMAPPDSVNNLPEGIPLPPGLAAIGDDPRALIRTLLLPLFVTLGGLIVPGTMANYILLAERENRTIELLVALPVRVGQILLAKLLVILLLASGITITLFAIDAVLIIAFGIGSIAFVAALLLLLLCALAYSTASALLISLLSRDFRTANNITGALIVPSLLLTMGVLLFVPTPTLAVLALALLYVLAAIAVTQISLRVITFERLLR
jgi:ABC-2 type transport system permease protein